MNIAEATEMYAAHLNFLPRVREEEWCQDDIDDFEAQTEQARKAMEQAWLEECAR